MLLKLTSCTWCRVISATASAHDALAIARAIAKHLEFGGGQVSVAVAVPGGRWHRIGMTKCHK